MSESKSGKRAARKHTMRGHTRRRNTTKKRGELNPVGYSAEYCPMCDDFSRVIGVKSDKIYFRCIGCGVVWSRPVSYVEIDNINRRVIPVGVDTLLVGRVSDLFKKRKQNKSFMYGSNRKKSGCPLCKSTSDIEPSWGAHGYKQCNNCGAEWREVK